MSEIIFITGTSTGVGKTVATGALLYALRQRGVRALALKPFCTGSRGDARHLRRLQQNELSIDEVNPFFYREPLAPYVASRGRSPSLGQVVEHILRVRDLCDVLLVEGAGGLLVPLGKDYSADDVIRDLNCAAVVVAPNKLGTLNHTLLTIRAMPTRRLSVVLMGQRKPDLSARSNADVLQELVRPIRVVELKYLGGRPLSAAALVANRRDIGGVAREVGKALGIL